MTHPVDVELDWSARIYSPRYLSQLIRDAADMCRADGQRLVSVRVHHRTYEQYLDSDPILRLVPDPRGERLWDVLLVPVSPGGDRRKSGECIDAPF